MTSALCELCLKHGCRCSDQLEHSQRSRTMRRGGAGEEYATDWGDVDVTVAEEW